MIGLVDVAPLMPVPTRLYGLVPGNTASGNVESLTGYITRLAGAHCIPPTLLIDAIGNELATTSATFSPLKNFGTRTKKYINGIDKNAIAWMQALSEWTGQDLHRCTLEWTSDLLAGYHLLGNTPRYCPLCLKDHEANGTEVIDQLLWHVKVVKACPVHGVLLRDRKCGSATKPSVFARKAGMGHCTDCGAIGYHCDQRPLEEADAGELWIAKQVQELLAYGSTHRRLDRNDLVRGINQLAIHETNGKVAALARISNLSRSLIWEMAKRNSTTRISLPALLQLASAFKVSITSLLSGTPEFVSDTPLVEFPKEIKRKFVTDYVQDVVLHFKANKNLSLSVTKMAYMFDCSRRTISDADPEFVKQVIASYDEAQAVERAVRNQEVADEVEAVVMKLAAAGQSITLRNAALITGKRWMSSSKKGKVFKAIRKAHVPEGQGELF